MPDSKELLEEMRQLHERRDRLELALADEMMVKRMGHKDQLDSQHRQKQLLDKYMASSRELLQLYKREPIRHDHNKSAHRACTDFYERYGKILDTPDAELEDEPLNVFIREMQPEPSIAAIEDLLEPTSVTVVVPAISSDNAGSASLTTTGAAAAHQPAATVVAKLVEFSDEEGYGRYLDLIACHEAFLQVVKDQDDKPNYLAFLTKFDKFHREIERERKTTPAYKRYTEMMLAYFRDYARRARPLFDYEADLEAPAEEKFCEQWANRTFAGWFSEADRQQHQQQEEPMVELASYSSVEQLAELGLDCLKRELQVRGLKCGGTLQDRAQRLWSVRGKRPEEIDDSLRATATAPSTNGGGGKKNKKKKVQVEPRHIASIEAKLAAYAEYFADHRQATIENVQRKQARTADERNESDDDDASDLEADDDDASDQDDDGGVVYNPKNLPLGWDGKPIPYWMYKLHGLNLSFTCEICGNAIYKGPKTFQRHFAEQRHAHGMKCLGIPNTAHFADITSIQEAITLWEKLRGERQRDQFQAQADEEFEDSQGNVVNRKTYEDLKRQGLL